MILILHGNDSNASYARLSKLLLTYSHQSKIRLTPQDPVESLALALSSLDMVSPQKIVICENFISQGKILKNLASFVLPSDILVFWEDKLLKPKQLVGFQGLVRIETFKKQLPLFNFLDSISPKVNITLKNLAELPQKEYSNLTWQLAYRFLLMIFAKIKLNYQQVSQIINKPVAPWQWSKIQSQATRFDLTTLLKLYNSTLQIEGAIKKGKTNLDETTLISLMFVKYFER